MARSILSGAGGVVGTSGASGSSGNQAPEVGRGGVELAKSSRSFCGWCDTAIAIGTPRVRRAYLCEDRQGGGGRILREEYMHAACAFHYDDGTWVKSGTAASRKDLASCVGCGKAFATADAKKRALSLFSSPL